jgi:hypothetical protein
MGSHVRLFDNLISAYEGRPFTPFDPGGGSVNYKIMYAAAEWIDRPTAANAQRLLDMFATMKQVGHLSLKGKLGVQCEAGAPGQHWSFNVGSVLCVLAYADGSWKDKPLARQLRVAALSFVDDEVGLDRNFRYGTMVSLPCPRVVGGSDDPKAKRQSPIDGYRNVFVQLALGEKVKKGAKYWGQRGALAVRVMRELMTAHPEWVERFKKACVPKLYLPIIKESEKFGSSVERYVAFIEDTPEARKVMGADGCHRVENGPDGVRFQLDWRDEWLVPGAGDGESEGV